MDIQGLRDYLKNFQFQKLFLEGLGWENPANPTSGGIEAGDSSIRYSKIAEINGIPVLRFDQTAHNRFKGNPKKFHKAIKKRYNKHLLLFSDGKSFFTLSYLSKEEQVRPHEYFKGQTGDYFISKLKSIHFGIEEDPKITKIGEKLEKAFNTEKVTKRFYQDFKDNHSKFIKHIEGIKSEEEKKWYASLILNRLMFIYFLQKKDFVNDDPDYLKTKLKESQSRGKDRYYQEFLTLLFFEGFAKKTIERSEKAKNLLGKIKYLNGGLFIPHPIEEKYGIKNSVAEYKTKIKISDKAFEETFEVFDKYDWLLQGKKGKSDSEVTPDVMGYIFEKYINQQKSLGAYYTRDEITQYLSRGAIQNAVLEKVNQKGYEFQKIEDLLHKLDAPLCKILLTNDNSILNHLTVLDPAVGSGAFLTSGMKELINIYSPIIGKIETSDDRELKKWLLDFKDKNKSLAYGIKKNIILKNLYGVDIMKEAVEVCKLRLFLSLASSALEMRDLEPLPNLDFNIMCGNSLIGFLREGEEAEKQDAEQKREKQIVWSEILGESYSQIKSKYNQLVSQYKNQPLSFAQLKKLKNKTNQFLKENNQKLNRALADKCNSAGVQYPEVKDIQEKKKITKKRSVRPEDFYSKDTKRNLNPFHWDFAFNEIIARGGFDVILTNPPWEKVKSEDREFFCKYDSSIDKKKSSKAVIKSKKDKLLKDPKIMKDYKKTEEFYLFQRNYFSKLYQYQIGTITNSDGSEKQASADMDSYRLFIERAFKLIGKNGTLGIVLPSGLCKDDGAIGLRKDLLFKKTKIEGLIDFQNQMETGKGKIFEGVHPQFKFLLLNLQKTKPQDKFPCLFHARNLTCLEHFPKTSHRGTNMVQQSIEEIKKFSPRDCAIIEFKNPKDKEILKKASCFPTIGAVLQDSWNPVFYTEFHETNDSHLFKNKKLSNNDLPLYKGSAIYQYEFNYDLSHVNRYVNLKSPKAQGKGHSFKNKCYKNYRLVIRTIAGNTNERSLISAVIPKNYFISNNFVGISINCPIKLKAFQYNKNLKNWKTKYNQYNSSFKDSKIYSHSDKEKQISIEKLKERFQSIKPEEIESKSTSHSYGNKYMLLLQAFLNSFVVDYFIRQKISSVINQKYLDSLPIPRLTEKDPYFKKLIKRSAKLTCIGKEFDDLADEIGIPRGGVTDQQERWKTQGEIDAIVANVYGLTLKEFEYILSTFTTGKNQDRLNALKDYALESFNKFLDKAS